MFGGNKEEEKKDEGDEEKEEQEEDEAAAGSKVTSMKAGEYVLHVLVETGKNIDLEGEDTVDPMVKISFMAK